MWPKLREQIEIEREMLDRLVMEHRELIVRSESEPPNRIELSALAAVLHGFYSGVENIFKRIAIAMKEARPEGSAWHKELLEMMSYPEPGRPRVVSPEMAERLRQYLVFRHFFRVTYPFQLRWERMAPLVRDLPEVLEMFNSELDEFIIETEANQ